MNVLARASAITTSVLAVAAGQRRPGSVGAHRRGRGSAPDRSFRRDGSGAAAAGRHRSGGTLHAVVPTRPFLIVSPADSRVAC